MEINVWLGPSCMTRVIFMLETRPWPVVSVLAEGRSPRCYGAWASANTVAELLPVVVSSDHSTSGAFSDSFTSSQSVPWSCGLILHLGDRPHPMMQAPTWSSRLRTNLFFTFSPSFSLMVSCSSLVQVCSLSTFDTLWSHLVVQRLDQNTRLIDWLIDYGTRSHSQSVRASGSDTCFTQWRANSFSAFI